MRDRRPPGQAYFLGIAGAGMSALASLLKSEGWRVSGSDKDVFPPITTYLDRLGIPWRDGFDARAVPWSLDLAIIGSSAKLDLAHNPERAEIARRGVPAMGFPHYLGQHTRERHVVVVAGSFGKSTVTALCAHLARAGGRDPGYFIGAAPLDLPASGHSGAAEEIFLEGDEYIISPEDRRPKFALYHPRDVILTSIVHDHVNVYPTMSAYEAPFEALVAQVPADGLLVAARGYPVIARLAEERLARGLPVVWYGAGPGEGYGAERIAIGEITRFDLVTPSGARIPLATQQLGLHNIENLVGACALLLERGWVRPEDLPAAAVGFRGLERRLDRKTLRSRAPVYEGFGSSYEKARSAIEAVRLHFPDRPLIVIFEPHTFSWRNREALAWYARVFDGVDRVLLLPPPVHGAQSHDQLSADDILMATRGAGVRVEAMADADAVLADLEGRLTGDEVLLLLSSGPLAGLPARLPAYMDARFGAD
jgi:UDP-N-acetylmuramate: L-alanyl-gamma-D-glutamyl-meso-diaminopimelate ligase